jgi:hypothetical protein
LIGFLSSIAGFGVSEACDLRWKDIVLATMPESPRDELLWIYLLFKNFRSLRPLDHPPLACTSKCSCRDFAVLMMEAGRHWGFGARFVTGYIQMGEGQHGATHAWMEIYRRLCKNATCGRGQSQKPS